MPRYNFIIRIYQDTCNNPTLSSIDSITISDITIISKQEKFGDICYHKSNSKKFGYTFTLSKPFIKVSGSNSYPTLTFKGKYLDIIVKNFNRYPVFCQEYAAANNYLNGWGYTNYLNKGFPHQLLYRNIEILQIQQQ